MALLLTGCSGGTGSSTDTEPSSAGSAPTEEHSEISAAGTAESNMENSSAISAEIPGTVDTVEALPEETHESAGFALYGPGGDKIEQSEITRVDASDEADYMANGLSATNWFQASVSGSTYLAEPGGEYKRYKIGDDICGLTVFDAGCVFSAERDSAKYGSGRERYFASGYAEFEGSVTASGTIGILDEDTDNLEAGSVIFTPDSGTELPVMNYISSGDKGISYPADAMYPYIVLTGVTVENDGSHATLTLSGITVSSIVNGFSVMRAAASDVVFD